MRSLIFVTLVASAFAAPPVFSAGPNTNSSTLTTQIKVRNVANVAANTPNGTNISTNVALDSQFDVGSNLTISKRSDYVDVDISGNVNVGDCLNYTLVVSNTGQTKLLSVNITDIDAGFAGPPNPVCIASDSAVLAPGDNFTGPYTMDPGSNVTCTYCHNITVDDINPPAP
jgi:hypothetical protein